MKNTTPPSEPAADVPSGGWSVGGRFIDALARRDFAGLTDCLDPDVGLRALLPPGSIEVAGSGAVVDRFRRWFGGDDEFEVVDATVGELGPRLYLRWRVRMTPPAGGGPSRVVEQHAFVSAGTHITGVDLLCSGFVPEPVAKPTPHPTELETGAPSCPST